MKMGRYEELFAGLHKELIPYYRYWCHDCPMAVSSRRDQELHRMQDVLYRCAWYYVHHYREFLDVIPYEKEYWKFGIQRGKILSGREPSGL